MLTLIIVICFVLVLVVVLFYVLYRMNIYLTTLEEKLVKQITLTENLIQSMKEVIAADFLQNDGRLKKFNIQSEKHSVIFNGVRVYDEVGEL